MGKIYKLGEICEIKGIIGWHVPKGINDLIHQKRGEIPCFNIKDIQAENLNPDKKFTIEAVNKWQLPLTTKNSLLLSIIGTIGKVFYPRKEKCCFATTIICLEPNPNLVSPNYLYYLLNSHEKKIKSFAVGSTIPMLTKTVLSTLPIFLPSLQEQEKTLQNFQIVYNKFFKSEVIYNDFLLKMIKKILELGDLLFQKYKDSKIKIKDHFNLIRGKTPPTKNPEYYQNGTIKWINSGVLTNLYFLTDKTPASKLVTERAVQECQLFYARPNTVLFSDIDLNPEKIVWVMESENQSQETDGTHVWTLLGTDVWTLLGTDVWTLLGTDVYANATLFFALRRIDFSTYVSGSIINHLQGSTLLNMKTNWVSDPEKQKIFFTILNSKLAKIKDLHSQIKDLHSQIKDLLLLKYFGKK